MLKNFGFNQIKTGVKFKKKISKSKNILSIYQFKSYRLLANKNDSKLVRRCFLRAYDVLPNCVSSTSAGLHTSNFPSLPKPQDMTAKI